MLRKIAIWSMFALLVWLFVWKVYAQAQENVYPTTVIGEAQTADGNEKVFMVEQPAEAPNPLGNPISNNENIIHNNENVATQQKQQPDENITDTQDKQPENAIQAGKDFENTLMEANGRVYDIQSYPEGDLPIMGNSANPETIYSPNVNP